MPSSCGALLEGGLQAHVVERVILCHACFAAAGATEFEIGALFFETHCGEYIEAVVEPEPESTSVEAVEPEPPETLADVMDEAGSVLLRMDEAVVEFLSLIERAYAAGQRKGL